MAGIYVHVPYCKVKCHYCDFHFSTNLQSKERLLNAMQKEIQLQASLLEDEEVETIYFGGGTPSILEATEIVHLLSTIQSNFNITSNPEITLEGNPDDLSIAKLNELKNIGINRLSIGIQSFNDDILTFMNRAHESSEAISSVINAKKAGFENITIDLIYGVPEQFMETWQNDIKQFLNLDVPHLSAYCLTIEKNTVFGHLHQKNELNLPDDELSLQQFKYLVKELEKNGIEQYEISNFSKSGWHSKHNSAYWLNENYIGIGPSAHSYINQKRSWNIANNYKYIHALENNEEFYETEQLSQLDLFNEHILTRIRTKWGIEFDKLQQLLPEKFKDFMNKIETFESRGWISIEGNKAYLTREGKFLSDHITAELFRD